MKSISLIGLLILAFTSNSISAQTKTDSIKVSGNCQMCKQRIEAAAMLSGVTSATWNVSSKLFTVAYDSNKVNFKAIQKNIASSGHDTGQFKASDLSYNRLPGCCQYDRSKSADKKAMTTGHQHN